MKQIDDPQTLRAEYIRALGKSENSTGLAKNIAEDLFALDLTVYSNNFSFDSLVYNAFAKSYIDDNISLHPEQLQIINHIKDNEASIISAPTSFGKTFCIFEYIVRYTPKNIVLIVPTLALVDEYFKKIIKKFHNKFRAYKIHTNISDDKIYDFANANIFILTHDRVVQESLYHKIEKIDFMVIDEVYKLETDKSDDRVLVLNMAYYHLSKKAKKYVLLAPFIKSIEDTEKLEKKPVFFNTNYSPVVNEVKINPILTEEDRFPETKRLLGELNPNDKTLIYFPTVHGMYNYITRVVANEPVLRNLNPEVSFFIAWAREEIHEDWCLINALERGYLIHNGQIPVGTRIFQLDYYEQSDIYNKLLCTSTLLEGVNTTAKNIIITKPSRKSARPGEAPFSAFDFFNLVGRTGRLYKHYIGDAYYIKSQNDPEFKIVDAIKKIKFEITDKSIDIDIQKGNIDEHPEVILFFEQLGITKDEYIANIGTKLRFDNVVAMYERYAKNFRKLCAELQKFLDNDKQGRNHLVDILYLICGGMSNNENPRDRGLIVSLITNLLSKKRPRLKKVIDDTKKFFDREINYLISEAIKVKTSFIEHTFYNRVTIIRYFLQLDNVKEELIEVLNDHIINTIEFLYFANLKHKKMLLDLGIYERDIDKVIKVIGDDFDDAVELKQRLAENLEKIKDISYITKYIIKNII